MVEKIGQVAITVADLEKSTSFYKELLGLKYLFHDANVAYFDLNGSRLVLWKSEKKDQKPYGTIIYYQTDDLNADFEKLKKKSVKVTKEPHFVSKSNGKDIRMAYLQDIDENVFALMEEK